MHIFWKYNNSHDNLYAKKFMIGFVVEILLVKALSYFHSV